MISNEAKIHAIVDVDTAKDTDMDMGKDMDRDIVVAVVYWLLVRFLY
jgi:hypothetical protein